MIRIFLFLITVSVLSLPVEAQNRLTRDSLAPRELSQKRENQITAIIDYKMAARLDLLDSAVMKDIMSEIAEAGIIVEPKESADTRNHLDIQKEAQAKLKKNYEKKPSELAAETRADLEKRLTPIQVGDEVEIQYTKANRIYSKKGKFGGIVENNRRVKIGFETLAIHEMNADDQIRLYPDKLKAHIDEEVERVKKDYVNELRAILSKQISEIRDALEQKNESAGYIFTGGKWISAKTFAESYVAENKSKIDPMKAPSKRTMLPEGKLLTDEDDKKIRDDANRSIRAWGLAKYTDIDAVPGLIPVPWLVSSDAVEVLQGKSKGYAVRGATITFGMTADPFGGIPADAVIELYNDHMVAFKLIFAVKNTEEANAVVKKIEAKYGKPSTGVSPIPQDKEEKLIWNGSKSKVKAELQYLPGKPMTLHVSRLGGKEDVDKMSMKK